MLATDWVQAQSIGAPPALVRRVNDALRATADGESGAVAEALLRACENLLDAVIAPRDGDARAAALDLLAADACVTWAFEAGADDASTIGARAEDAMRRITLAAEKR